MSTLLKEIRDLKQQVPEPIIDVDGGICLLYDLPSIESGIIVRFDMDGSPPAACLAGRAEPGWWKHEETWAQLRASLLDVWMDLHREVPMYHLSEGLRELREHLTSVAWLVRLIAEMR